MGSCGVQNVAANQLNGTSPPAGKSLPPPAWRGCPPQWAGVEGTRYVIFSRQDEWDLFDLPLFSKQTNLFSKWVPSTPGLRATPSMQEGARGFSQARRLVPFIRGIATPVCATLRNDGSATPYLPTSIPETNKKSTPLGVDKIYSAMAFSSSVSNSRTLRKL